MIKNLTRYLNSQKGSAILMALVAVAVLGLMAGATATIAGRISQQAQKSGEAERLNDLVQSIETVVTNSKTCSGFAVTGGQDFRGLTFGGNNRQCNEGCREQSLEANGRQVLLQTMHRTSTGNSFLESGTTLPDLRFTINRLYLKDMALDPVNANTYRANLMVQATSIDSNTSFAPRVVAEVIMKFDGTNTMTSCEGKPSAQAHCESLSCRWNADASEPCTCGFPDIDCNSDRTAPPWRYIAGWNFTENRPNCGEVNLRCAPGLFLSGVGENGQPLCLAAEGTTGPPPATEGCWVQTGSDIDLTTINDGGYPSANSSCAAGLPQLSRGGACSPLGADCTWAFKYGFNEYECRTCPGSPPAAPTCTGGASTTVSGEPALPVGCYCQGGQTWNGSSCVDGGGGPAVACVETVTEVMCSLGGGGCESRSCSSLRGGDCSCRMGGAAGARSWGSGGGGVGCEGGSTTENIIYEGTPEAAFCPGRGGGGGTGNLCRTDGPATGSTCTGSGQFDACCPGTDTVRYSCMGGIVRETITTRLQPDGFSVADCDI